MNIDNENWNRLLCGKEAAELLGVGVRALEAWRYRGTGPRYVGISGRAVRYRQSDLIEWIESLIVSPNSEAKPQQKGVSMAKKKAAKKKSKK